MDVTAAMAAMTAMAAVAAMAAMAVMAVMAAMAAMAGWQVISKKLNMHESDVYPVLCIICIIFMHFYQ